MEDDLIFYKNGRQPPFFLKFKTSSIFWLREDKLYILKNGRQKAQDVLRVGSALRNF
jgi:hypothetical protein